MSGSEPSSAPAAAKKLRVAHISVNDIFKSIGAGLRDMQRAPLYSLSFGLVYAAFGWLILYLMIAMNYGSYTYPMATGFALVAPMAAGGCYEISRLLEKGLPVSFAAIFKSMFGPHGQAVAIMAVVTTFAYLIWLDIAAAIYVVFFGMHMMTVSAIIDAILTTPQGAVFFIIGNSVGLVLATVVFSIMVVSLPVVFDRHVDFVTGMIMSVKAVLANPKPMLLWCAIIGVLLMLSFASLFAGLIVVFPLLGHATWHLYRRVIEHA